MVVDHSGLWHGVFVPYWLFDRRFNMIVADFYESFRSKRAFLSAIWKTKMGEEEEGEKEEDKDEQEKKEEQKVGVKVL